MADGPETRLVKRMVEAIKKEHPSAWIVKIAGGRYQTAGIPDLVVVVSGQFIALEAKAQGPTESAQHARDRVTPQQEATIAKILRGGGVAGVVISVEEALELVSKAVVHLD